MDGARKIIAGSSLIRIEVADKTIAQLLCDMIGQLPLSHHALVTIKDTGRVVHFGSLELPSQLTISEAEWDGDEITLTPIEKLFVDTRAPGLTKQDVKNIVGQALKDYTDALHDSGVFGDPKP